MWLLLGIGLLALVFVDALWTTLWVDGGGGPLTSRLTTWSWRAVLTVVGRRRHRVLSLFGPAILVVTVAVWSLLLWGGWVLVYASEPASLLTNSDFPTPASWTGRIWFVAFAISTMGNGDYSVAEGVWQLVASVTTLSAFFLATLVISYLLSVLAAVVAKRAFAGQVSAMGGSPTEILRNAWDGESFQTLDLQLNATSGELGALTEQYMSYPVLQYYHAARRTKSPTVATALLDETLTIMRFGIPAEHRPTVAVLHAARSSVAAYLETLDSAFIEPADETPPLPDLDALRTAGIPTVDDPEFADAVEGLRTRRRKLMGLLLSDGWNWPEWRS